MTGRGFLSDRPGGLRETERLHCQGSVSFKVAIHTSSYFASYAPAIAILDLPFLFATDGSASQQAYDILNAGTSLDKYLESKGFVVGGFLFCANRYILSTHKIDSMSDLAGKNIWALPSPTLQNELKAYGASPVTLDPGDIAVALQNGTVNGVCTDPTFYFSMSLYESAKFINKIPFQRHDQLFLLQRKMDQRVAV
ncbi:MAG: TRAP transporter substrate-binding protein [Saccharofermentanales bacterium]